MIELAKLVLGGILPYPDLVRRLRVRRAARALVSRAPFPSDDLVTGIDLAQLALLRVLDLQRQTRRAVRGRHREAAVQLARSAMDVAIVGIWCLREPKAVAVMREAQLRSGKDALIGLFAMTDVFPDHVIEESVKALGPAKAAMPPVRNMVKAIDQTADGAVETELYQRLYGPLSAFFVHANAWTLSRHIGRDGQRRARPTMPWARRSPARLADTCVGLLAAAVATDGHVDAEIFGDYALAHGRRVLPPLGVLFVKHGGRAFNLRWTLDRIVEGLKIRSYLDGPGKLDTPAQREARVRALFDFAFADPDLPAEAIRPVVDHLVAFILGHYDLLATNEVTELGDSPG